MSPKLLCALAATSLLAAGCSDRSLGDDPVRDPNPPVLQVTSPERGHTAETQSVRVTGSVSDVEAGPVEVAINGVAVQVAGDGSFDTQINLPAGLTLIQTVATDESGNETIDTRAALAGEQAPLDRPVREAMAAHVGTETFAALAQITESFVDATDLGAVAGSANPVVDKGGSCLGVELDVDAINKSGTEIELSPMGGGIHVSLSVTDLDVDMTASYEFSCIGGSAGVDLDADRFTITGMMTLELTSTGDLDIGLVNTAASFEGFSLDVGVIPSSVVEFFVDDIDQIIADMIAGQVEDMVPSMAASFLADLTGSSLQVEVLGKMMTISVTPTLAQFDTNGGVIAMDTDIRVMDAEGGYVFTPRPMPSAGALGAAGQGFRIALADDAVNQVLASLHASGALEFSMPLGDGGAGSALGALADRLDIHMPLPPMVRADVSDGKVDVVVGDLIAEIVDESDSGDSVVTKVAISGRLELSPGIVGGRLVMQTSAPELWVDVLTDGVTGTNPLAYDQVEVLASAAIKNMAGLVDGFLANIPIPVFGGTAVGDTRFEPEDGYVIIGGSLSPQ
jgi:hypothetical protein